MTNTNMPSAYTSGVVVDIPDHSEAIEIVWQLTRKASEQALDEFLNKERRTLSGVTDCST